MADNTKSGRIAATEISLQQKFQGDLYSCDFLLHPADIPLSSEDIATFQLWKVNTMDLKSVGFASDTNLEASLKSPIRSDSLASIQQDIENIKQAQNLYWKICDFASHVHKVVIRQIPFSPGEPQGKIKILIEEVRKKGLAILRFQDLRSDETYISTHSANSFILSIALANAAQMPLHRLMNLALSALLHEVGLNRFSNLINRNKRFTTQEFQLQKSHVQEGINLLKMYNFPSEVSDGIIQHHERLDGSGYPYGISQQQISNFGRYLGLVCSYVAMTTDQVFRKSHLAHNAMLSIIKSAKVHYDGEMVRLLVQLLSLYPVGSYVELKNGSIGRVLRNNQQNPRLPIVQVLLDARHKPVDGNVVLQTSEEIKVLRPLPQQQVAQMIPTAKG